MDAANGNIRLQPCSPAINAGDNSAVPAGITTDLDGNPRFYNNGTVDMGAYEYQGEKPANPADGGEIAANQTVCFNTSPDPFTSSSAPTGFVGDLEYQWQISTSSPTFVDIPDAVSTTYTHVGTVTQTTWFRRLAKVTCESTWVESNTVTVYVPAKFIITDTNGNPISSPKLQNIPFDAKVTLVDAYDNPTPNVIGSVTVTLTGEGGLVTGTLSVQGAIGDPVEKVLGVGESELTFSNILYSGLSDIPGFDVSLSASAAGAGCASGLSGESNLFSVRDIFFSVEADPTTLIADGTSTSDLTVTLLDHDQNPLANQVITLETSYGTLMDGLTELPSTVTATTDANGQVKRQLRSASAVGIATVTAKCPGACPQTVEVEFVPGPPAKLAFTTQPSTSTVANQPFAQQPVVTIQDATGNTVTGSTLDVALALTYGTGSLSGTTTLAAIDGVATFAGLSIDLAGTDKVLTASATGLAAATTSPTFTILPSDPASFAITGPDVLSAGVQSGDYTITIYDEYGNPTNVSAATVIQMSTSSSGSNSFAPLQVTIPSGTSTGTFRYTDHQLPSPAKIPPLREHLSAEMQAWLGKQPTK